MIRKCALVLLIFALRVLPAGAQATLPADLESILQASTTGENLNQALAAANAYIAVHPNDGNGFAVRCEVGVALVEQHAGDVKAVLSDCGRALALAPQSAFAHYAAADVFYNGGYFKASLDQYNQAIVLGETGRGIFWKRCDAERRLGRLDDALTDCNKQVTLTPGDPFARYARGRLEVARQAYAAAVADLGAALSNPQRPFVVDAYYWRGTAYASLGEYAAADADLSSAIARGDMSPDTYFQRAQVREHLGREAEAQADLQKAADGYRAAGLDGRAAAAEAMLRVPQNVTAPASPSPSRPPPR
jgi:tetratricopeptide (TPR) repeat protein